MLTFYQQRVQQMISDERESSVNIFDLRGFINSARGQVAISTECLRTLATYTLPPATPTLATSAIAVTSPLATVTSVRQIAVVTGNGPQKLEFRGWEWFWNYGYTADTPAGVPTLWTQLAAGNQGTIYFNPQGTGSTNLLLDCVCVPIDLQDDTTVEPIGYPFTEAVPFYAAYLAALNMRDIQKAQGFYGTYMVYMKNAMAQSTPTVLVEQFANRAAKALANASAMPLAVMPPQASQGGGHDSA